MEASEVLKKYAAGERNFQRVNLREQYFQGQDLKEVDFSEADLHGANFSNADLRGANFSNANLRGAKFSGAKCGLQERWAAFLVICSWLLAGISGLVSRFRELI